MDLLPVDSSVVNRFIKDCLLEHRDSTNQFSVSNYECRWTAVNRLNLFVLVVFKGILPQQYVVDLLTRMKACLIGEFSDQRPVLPADLSADFKRIMDKCDKKLAVPVSGGRKSRESEPVRGKPGQKEGRAWGISQKATSAKVIDSLDYSSKQSPTSEKFASPVLADEASEVSQSSGQSDDEKRSSQGLLGRMVARLSSITGNAALTAETLKAALSEFQTDLMQKNVARDVAERIVQGVGKSLEGTQTERYVGITKAVRAGMVTAITEILTPKKSVDVLKGALDAKEKGEVFSIAFLGVNGVGKSTNLAKVAYFLKHKGGLKVLIAACDTFRSGAVEQLRTHAKCLDVELFERGYGKDSADIAKQALGFAKAQGFDVCLIDTAGRMQDNEPLMRAIGKLVAVNAPNLVLFVGEALVGHDAVDQLEKFNRALLDNANRAVDGIILTKYDTVDEKVGAALSMVFVTGQPIVFVGTGQRYPHLRRLEPAQVVKALMG